MDGPLVSVLMTAYNREKYIAEAIESVLASTYKNFELIIVDDRSSDNTLSIAKSYAAKDERIRVYCNEENLGDYPNRNKAASYAKGKYLKYVDSDDKIYPHCLEVMVNSMEQFPEATWGLVSAQSNYNFGKPFPFQLTPSEIFRYDGNGVRILSRAPLSLILKRECFEKENGFLPVRQWGDAELSRRWAIQYNLVIIEPDLVWYRTHDDQENAINSKVKRYSIVASNRFIELYNSSISKLDKETTEKLVRKQKKLRSSVILKSLLSFQFKEAISLYKLVQQNVQQ